MVCCERSLVIDATSPQTIGRRGVCRAKLGDVAGARVDLRVARDLFPRDSPEARDIQVLLDRLDEDTLRE
jgi:Flp pilus assembly protein TadD